MTRWGTLAWTAALAALAVAACRPRVESLDEIRQRAHFVGRTQCEACHEQETTAWTGSYHDLAMQPATEETVRGRFDQTQFTHFGRTSTFYKRDGRFYVKTENAAGELEDFPIAYTFGVYPLQQYLIAFPGGRYQALSICWDDRPAEEGGQRWFFLYPDEPVPPSDPLHWTGPYETWNYMCAECHSTDLRKGYDPATDTYRTSWSEINVSCEACHGPGSEHVAWAGALEDGTAREDDPNKGLLVHLGDPYDGVWQMDASSGTARRSTPLLHSDQITTCARCHSRRLVLSETYEFGRPLLDTHLPQWLDEDLYFADGQIRDEVYVYGSFVQSKMYAAGVVCSDCHDPHTAGLRAPGNALCGSCHLPARYDTFEHHRHRQHSTGSQCVECHMPSRTYMVVDPRRDHAMRIPQPALAARIGAPDACTACHTDRTQAWAARSVAEWFGADSVATPHVGDVLRWAQRGNPTASPLLISLARSDSIPAIVRATAVSLFRRFPSPEAVVAARGALSNPDPLVRVAALGALEMLPPEQRPALAMSLLSDPVLAVRVEAARVLAPTPSSVMTPEDRERLRAGLDEAIASVLVNADRAEAHLQLGVLHSARGQMTKAEEAYRTALRINPRFIQAYVNLADLYRERGRDDLGEATLREALEVDPTVAEVHHALGLLHARAGQLDEALAELRRAAQLEPAVPRFAYVYAIALHTAGRSSEAVDVLTTASRSHPADEDVLTALVTINRDRGTPERALPYARRLAELRPDDPAVARLLSDLGNGNQD